MKLPIPTETIEAHIGYTFRDKSLLLAAFLHRSYGNEHATYRGQSNERLEFLGDAVLSLVVAERAFHTFKDRREGTLTLVRSAIVSQKALSAVSKRLGLGDTLLLAKGEEESGGRENPSLLANVYEALIGAVYLDGRLPAARLVIQKTLFSRLPTLSPASVRDHKSLLQEKIQKKQKATPFYRVERTHGPDHKRTFQVAVFIGNKKVGVGEGGSKQEAEQEAAKNALFKNDGGVLNPE